ncbi:unnamed protein product, partial [marine sediment metagenome]
LYREKNRDIIIKNKKEYYKENKEEIYKRVQERKQTYDGTIKNLLGKRKEYNKKRGHECDLNIEYIENLIKKQNSKCVYCEHDLEIKFNSGNLAQISIDRIDSSEHYKKSNIQITCIFCNLAKNDLDDSMYKKFIDVLRGKTHDFIYTEYRHIISNLANACRQGDMRKKYCTEDTISTNQIRELIKKQNNKCAISGIEFINAKDRSFPFKMSVDRIDNSKGHTFNNCQLVCLGIQRGKLDKSDNDAIKYVKEMIQSI